MTDQEKEEFFKSLQETKRKNQETLDRINNTLGTLNSTQNTIKTFEKNYADYKDKVSTMLSGFVESIGNSMGVGETNSLLNDKQTN